MKSLGQLANTEKCLDKSLYLMSRYQAHGGSASDRAGNGGPGTVFLYHLIHTHRTLLIDNNNKKPFTRDINWDKLDEEGGRAWIMPDSGIHHLAGKQHRFHFEELQIYSNAHLATWPLATSVGQNISLFFKFMIGDRTGFVHIGNQTIMDLNRPEIDLPFSAHVYLGGHLGLAPVTTIHGVQIILRGVLAYVKNLTLHHGGELWLNPGGRTHKQNENNFDFKNVLIQDTATIYARSSQINEPAITFNTRSFTIEGGARVLATYLILNTENINIDDGGELTADYQGYNTSHGYIGRGIHGAINPGHGSDHSLGGSGAGHGGSGGSGNINGGAKNTGRTVRSEDRQLS